MYKIVIVTAALGLAVSNAFAVDAPDQAGFVNSWHNLGEAHQDNQDGTAQDRHGMDDKETAGKSDHNPTTEPN